MSVVADFIARLRLKPDKGSFSAADKLLGGVKKALVALVAYEGVRWFAGLIQGAADAADHISKLAQSTGVSSKELQELGYAGSLSDISMDEMAHTVQKLAKNIDMAARGGKAQAAVFAHMGIKVRDATGQIRPASDVLGDVADHIAALNENERPAAAIEALGRQGARMIPFLKDGRKGIEALKQEAEDLGVVLDDSTLKSAEDFNDQQSRIAAVWQGFKYTLLKALLPTLKGIVDATVIWFKANRRMIALRVQQFAEGLAAALKILWQVLTGVAEVVGFLIEHLQLLAIIVGSLIGAMILLGDVSVGAALAAAAEWLAATLPLILTAALIAALVLALQDLYSWFKGGDSVLKDWLIVGVRAAVAAVKAEFQEFLDWVESKGQNRNIVNAAGQTVLGKQRAAASGNAYAATSRFQEARRRGIATPLAADAGAFQPVKAPDEVGDDLFDITGGAGYGHQFYVGQTAKRTFGASQLNAQINLKLDQSLTPEEAASRVREAFESEWGVKIDQAAATLGGGGE